MRKVARQWPWTAFPKRPFWLGIEADQPPWTQPQDLAWATRTIIIQLLTVYVSKLEGREFTLYGVPLPLEGLDGSPARVFAITE